MARVNLKRLALSFAVVGMVAVPLWTGSAKRFDQYPGYLTHPDAGFTCQEIQDAARDVLGGAPSSKRADLPPTPRPTFDVADRRTLSFARDVVAGFALPFLASFVVPAIARAYVRWVTL